MHRLDCRSCWRDIDRHYRPGSVSQAPKANYFRKSIKKSIFFLFTFFHRRLGAGGSHFREFRFVAKRRLLSFCICMNQNQNHDEVRRDFAHFPSSSPSVETAVLSTNTNNKWCFVHAKWEWCAHIKFHSNLWETAQNNGIQILFASH